MFGKQKSAGRKRLEEKKTYNLNLPDNLTSAEKKQIQQILKKYQNDSSHKKPKTTQDSIPFERMFSDGICRVKDNYYTKTIQFQDINYQLLKDDDKAGVFDAWCSFLNYFDSSTQFQILFVNMNRDAENYRAKVEIPLKGDGFDDVRKEYSGMLLEQMSKGNNGITRNKYLTFGVNSESLKLAKPKLERIQTDIFNNFKTMSIAAWPLDGADRLKLMHDIFNNMGSEQEKFRFNWNWLPSSGLSVKDFVAPSSFSFTGGHSFEMGKVCGEVSYIDIQASEMGDDFLKELLNFQFSQVISIQVQPVDQASAIKQIKHTITEIDRSKIEEQTKATRTGYDPSLIPNDLNTYSRDARRELEDLQSRNERSFLVTMLVMHTGNTRQELDNNVFQTKSFVQERSCSLRRLDYQQEQGLMSCLPLACSQVQIQRTLTSSSLGVMIPFTTQELFQVQDGNNALYYGLNALSSNLIMADRKLLKNPNGLILGTPGSGKSFSAKREIANAFLATDDDIIICDPEGEYTPLVRRLKGQVIKISSFSRQYINPMDINSNYSEEDNPISLKSDFILSLCELIMGGKEGLQPVEKTVIDRCVHEIYRKYFEDPRPENMPILEDLYDALLNQEEKEAQKVATALEIYVKGSLNLFNHRTNVNVKNRIVCYDIKDLGKQMKKIGMLMVQDQVWGRVTANRNMGKTTRYYIDEMHLLLREEQTASYTVEIWKRFRKWGGVPTGITQNIKDLFSSPEIQNILENSDFMILLNQAAGDRQILTKQLNLSPDQQRYITQSDEGQGLLFYGSVVLPFVDRFPKNLELYRIMTTKLSEVTGSGQNRGG